MSTIELLVYALLGFITSIASGIAGGGAGFIMTPLLIFFGLTPAQAVSTGKINGLAVTVGSLSGLRNQRIKNKRLVIVIMSLALAIGLITPRIILSLDNDVYERALGIILLILIPFMYFKKIGHQETSPSTAQKSVGYVVLTISMLLQAIFSGGLGTLVNMTLMGLLGLNSIDANIVKRYSQLLLNFVIIIGVLGSGVIVWQVALVGIIGSLSGGYIGGKLAIKKGTKVVSNVLLLFALIAAISLIL